MIAKNFDDETVALRDKRTRSPGFFRDPSLVKSKNSITAPPVCPDKSVSGRIFPNGEFGVGFVPRRGISAKERRYDADCRYAQDNAEIVPDVQISPDGEQFTYGRKIIPGQPPPKLGIGSELSQKPRKYGLKGITGYGRKMTRNAGTLIEKAFKGKYGHIMQMGTVTVPSYPREDMHNICCHWGDVVRRFYQECKRQYARKGYVFNYVSVTEVQPKRLSERSEVGLHLHFLFVAIRDSGKQWILPDTWVRETWERILKNYLGEGTASQSPNYRRESVSRSSAAYLSKYMSKGGEQVKQVVDEFGEDWLPSQWWSIDSQTRKSIKHYTVSVSGSVAEKLLVISRWGVGEYIKYIRCITIPTKANDYAKTHNCPEEIVLGYGGLLTNSGFRLFTPGNHFADISVMFSSQLPLRK